jgi:hypothetical protein
MRVPFCRVFVWRQFGTEGRDEVNSRKKFTVGTIVASTCVGVATLFGFVAAVTDLLAKIHLTLIAFTAVGAAFVIATIVMWRGYIEALHDLEANTAQTKSDMLLGKSRLQSDAIALLKSRVKTGPISEIDIGGLALRSNFFKNHSEFGDDLLLALRRSRELKVRIWLLDPRSKAIEMREMAEREKSQGMLQQACEESLETIRKIVDSLWNEQRQRRPQVVLVDKIAITQFIFRVDDEMVVTPYLQHDTGNSSPTIFLKKGDRWFDVYKRQFESCFSMHSDNLYPPDEELSEPVRI